MTKILNKSQLAPNVHSCTVEAPDVAKKAQPGQFVILIPDEFSERIPMTIADWNAHAGTVTFVFVEVGATTQRLAELEEGGSLYSFTGPLGKPFELEKFGNVALMGGCYGLGGIYPAARSLKFLGNNVTCMIEARSEFLLYWTDKIESVADEVVYATVDGSKGHKGHAHDALERMLKAGSEIDYVMVVGCTFMMHRVCEVTKPYNIKTIVSMNPVMIDGTGMCGACRLLVDDVTRFACVDGPHFDGHLVNWDLIRARRNAYLEEEVISEERC